MEFPKNVIIWSLGIAIVQCLSITYSFKVLSIPKYFTVLLFKIMNLAILEGNLT